MGISIFFYIYNRGLWLLFTKYVEKQKSVSGYFFGQVPSTDKICIPYMLSYAENNCSMVVKRSVNIAGPQFKIVKMR